MRILLLVQHYPPERGAVRLTHELAVDLARRGHEVRVLTALPNYPIGRPYPGHGRFLPTRRMEDGVAVSRLPAIMASNAQPFRRIAGAVSFAVVALIAGLTGPRPDVILASLPPPTLAPVALLLRALRRRSLVLLLRDVEPLISFQIRGLDRGRLARLAIDLSMRLYARADRLVAVHDSQAPDLLAYGVDPRALDVITHGVDCVAFDAAATPGPAPELRRPGRALAVYCGTVGAAHDVESLVRSFADPRIRAMPLDLVIVGGGEYVPACRRAIRELGLDAVRLLDPIPAQEVPALLTGSDLLVMSYLRSARTIPGMIGSKFYEYCAAGRPVLVHGTGMGAELVRRIGNGWTCEAGNPGELARVLAEFLASPADARARGALGRRHAEQHFDKTSRHERWERILCEAAAGRGTPSGHGARDGTAVGERATA